jgi:hypothetical protein
VAVEFSLEDLALLPVLIGYTIWWASDLRRGSGVHPWTLVLHLVVYGLAAFYVWAVSLGEIVLAGASSSSLVWIWTLELTAVVVAASEVGQWYGTQRMVVERTSSGSWRYRGPVAIAALWLGLYLARFGLEDGLLGGYSVFLPTGRAPHGIPLDTFVVVVLVVATLYLTSFGFMFGISRAVWDRHREKLRSAAAARSGAEPAAGPPAPAESGAPSTRPGPVSANPPAGDPPARPATPHPAGSADPDGPGRPPNPPMNPPPAPAGRTCPACGRGTRPGAAFCGQCGHALPSSP